MCERIKKQQMNKSAEKKQPNLKGWVAKKLRNWRKEKKTRLPPPRPEKTGSTLSQVLKGKGEWELVAGGKEYMKVQSSGERGGY